QPLLPRQPPARAASRGAIWSSAHERMFARTMSKTPSSPQVSVTIAPEQLEAIRTSLLELYQVCADALNHDVTRHLRAGDALTTMQARRAELASLDRLLAQSGWPGEPGTHDPVTFSGPAGRLREVAWLALLRATSELDEACGRYWRGDVDVAELGGLLDTARDRLAMLADIAAAASP